MMKRHRTPIVLTPLMTLRITVAVTDATGAPVGAPSRG